MGVAIVTGASSGLGQAIYKHLTRDYDLWDFARVIGVSRHGPDVHADITTPEGLDAVVDVAQDGVDCLVNCAGILHLGEDDALNAINTFAVNFWGPYHLMMALRPSLIKVEGVVINIASVSGIMADEDTPVYGASKAALISLTKSLAIRWARYNVRVNAISPGFFKTNLVPEETPDELIARVPLGYEADPVMICPIVTAILDSSYVTGANFVVDGGLSCQVALTT